MPHLIVGILKQPLFGRGDRFASGGGVPKQRRKYSWTHAALSK